MLGSLAFIKHFQFAQCYIHDRRQSLFIFKVLSKDWILKTAWVRLALCQALIRLPPLSSFFQMGKRGRMTCAAWGPMKRAQVSACAPPPWKQLPWLAVISSSGKSFIWGRALFRGHCSVACLRMTLQKQGTLEKMPAEFGLWSCVADGSDERQEAWPCSVWLATLDSKEMLRQQRDSHLSLLAILI